MIKHLLVSLTGHGLVRSSLLLMVVLGSGNVRGQQNLFNIPSGEITPTRQLFYQHQINVYSPTSLESKLHVVYGLPRHWDVGVNFVDLPLTLRRGLTADINDKSGRYPLFPYVMMTAQKQWKISKKLWINAGTQVGPNVGPRGARGLAHWTYGLVRYPLGRVHLTAGPYISHMRYTGGSVRHPVGWMAGYEVHLGHGFGLMGDFISGQHKKSSSTIGGVVDLGRRAQLCIAALLDFPNDTLSPGVVVELNLFSWDFRQPHDN